MIVKTKNGFKNLSKVADLTPAKKEIRAYFENISVSSIQSKSFVEDQREKVENGYYTEKAKTFKGNVNIYKLN